MIWLKKKTKQTRGVHRTQTFILYRQCHTQGITLF